jgi:hypothetical protein
MPEAPIGFSRWLAKKAARTMMAAASAPALLATRGVRVLTYHRFGDARRAPFTVGAAAFERQMARLGRSGRAVSLGQVLAHVRGERSLPDGAVLVTADDGDPSVVEIAAPILQRHRVPAVAFVLAGRPAGFDVMSDADLRRLGEFGVDVGSHSVSHRSMARLPLAEARREAADSKNRLEQALGRPVTSFAYPFGTRADYSPAIADVLREVGYELAFTSQHGAVAPGADPMLLPRIKVEGGDPDWLFPLLCRGGLDGWRLIDAGLSGLQRPAPAAA